jgi:WD40 repeat protein
MDRVVRILDIDSGKMLQEQKGHTGPLTSIAFSPDGKKLVSASYDKTARIWDVKTGKVLQKLEGHTGFVMSAAFSPDGKEILTTGSKRSSHTVIFQGKRETFDADEDRTARIWNAESGKELKQLAGYKKWSIEPSLILSPDWKKVMMAFPLLDDEDGKTKKYIGFYDAESGKELQKFEVDYDNMDFFGSLTPSPDGQKIVMAGHGEEHARIYDVDSGKELQRWGKNVTSVIFLSDGKRIVTISDKKVLLGSAPTIQILDVEALLRPKRPAIMDF